MTLHQKVSIGGAYTSSNVRIKEFHDKIELVVYDRLIWKKKEGFEEIIDVCDVEKGSRGEGKPFITDKSLQRSFSIMRDYSLTNYQHFHSFITLTFSDNVDNLDNANGHFHNWVKKIKRIYPDFMYLGVPEYQKRGAIHYHIMTNLIPGTELLPKRETKYTYNKDKKKYFPLEYYDLPYWNDKNGSLGFSSAFDLKLSDDKFNITAYLTKYFFKEKDNRLFNRVKVLHSNNLKKPNVIDLIETSKECNDYFQHLYQSYELESERSITSTDPKIPSMRILEFKKTI